MVLQTLRSHDQYNTTIYGKDDRYRGIHGGRRVVLINADDITELGFADGDMVHLISEFQGTDRRAENFRIVSYSTPKGCAAAYYPETNVLVPWIPWPTPVEPHLKSVIIRLERPRSRTRFPPVQFFHPVRWAVKGASVPETWGGISSSKHRFRSIGQHFSVTAKE